MNTSTSTGTEVQLFLERTSPEGLSYMDCPACGRPKKLILIPLDEGGTLYHCLRSSCDTWGSVGNVAPRVSSGPTEEVQRRLISPHYGDVIDFHQGARDPKWFKRTFHLDKEEVEELVEGYLKKEGRHVFPIRDEVRKEVGYVARGYFHNRKALVRPFEPYGSLLAWYGHTRLYNTNAYSKLLILLEDQVSAVRLSRYFPTVALLGTNLSYSSILLLNKVWKGQIMVMLDADATKEGLQMARRIPNGRSWSLFGKDVKDMDNSEFAMLVHNLALLEVAHG